MKYLLESDSLVEELSGSGGDPFEGYMRELIRVEGKRHGLHPKDIYFDYRTSVPDGGIDLLIDKAHDQADPPFIPSNRSAWSFKAGKDGTKPSKFKSEVTARKHKELRDLLAKGGTYVWAVLQPVNAKTVLKFQEAADKLAKKYKFASNQIEFRWLESSHDAGERHPNILAEHVPKAWAKVAGLQRIDRWKPLGPDRVGFGVPWIELSGREQPFAKVVDHLSSSSGPALLHIAGLSGVGKTRLVMEACKAAGLGDTFYAPRYELLTDEMLNYLCAQGRHTRLVIDEVKTRTVGDLMLRLDDTESGIRIVSIGPATRQDARSTNSRQVIVLREPDEDTHTLAVVRKRAPEMPLSAAQFVAARARHDLRFAILLTDAFRPIASRPDLFPQTPRDVWNRVLQLYGDQPLIAAVAEAYRFLAVAVDVGHANPHSEELAYLANFFEIDEVRFRDCIKAAVDIGLGLTTRRFFEACPRGLAAYIFEEDTLHHVLPKVDELLKGSPDRLRRRIVERCHEVRNERLREEVSAALATYFQDNLGSPSVSSIVDRSRSRLIARWAELDPDRGLRWLARAVLSASDEDLLQFDGDPDGSGGWRGRRQIVWLLEATACFGNHFSLCEEVLFRLAQVETEPSIGNNASGVWTQMFSVFLASTEVPFEDRWVILMKRVEAADEPKIALILGAVRHALLAAPPMRLSPPVIVGGRIVPKSWVPASWQHAHDLQRMAAGTFLDALRSIHEQVVPKVRRFLIQNVGLFAHHGQVKVLLTVTHSLVVDPSDVRDLRNSVESVIQLESARRGREADSRWTEALDVLRDWLAATRPASLQEEVKALTSQQYWTPSKMMSVKDQDELSIPYREIASKLAADLPVLDDLQEWFGSPEAVSGQQLGEQLGTEDARLAAFPRLLDWLEKMAGVPFAVGYMVKLEHTEETRSRISNMLDGLATNDARNALYLTVYIDPTARGVERLLDLLQDVEVAKLQQVAVLAFEPWASLLGAEDKAAIADLLLDHVDAGEPVLLPTIARLCLFWSMEQGKPPSTKLLSQVLRYLKVEKDFEPVASAHEWDELVGLAMQSHPAEMARLLTSYAVALKGRSHDRADYALERLAKLASTDPKVVAVAIVDAMRDPEQRHGFYFLKLDKLFAAIGFNVLKPLIEEGDELLLSAVARHFPSPYLDKSGDPVVPEQTEWLLTHPKSGGRVLKEFLAGRHSGVRMSSGDAEQRSSGLRKLLAAFKKRPEKWIQQWIKFEEAELANDRRWEEEIDERLDRE